MQKGFTFVELIIVVALIFLFSGLIFPINYSFFQKSATRDQARNIQGSLRKAQAAAIAGRDDSNSGIKFFQVNYTLFEGEFYSDRRQAMDVIVAFPISISISGTQEVVFQKTTGLPIFPGLISHWEFNEQTYNIAYDTSYYVNENHGSVFGTWSRVQGKENRALQLSGDGFISVEHNDSLNTNQGITISAWINIASIHENKIIKKGSPEIGTGYAFSFSESGSIIFELGDGASVQAISNNYNPELLEQWVYLTTTWDGENMRQYINGELQPNTKSFNGSIGSSLDNLVIGQGLIGKIDDVRLYNYALSDQDIETNYLARKDDIVIGLKFGENRKYISINSQGRIQSTD